MRTSGPASREMGLGNKVSTQLLTVSDVLGDLGQFIFSLLKNDLSVPCEVLGELYAKKSQARLKCLLCSVISYTQSGLCGSL